jgi:hypothetical protein
MTPSKATLHKQSDAACDAVETVSLFNGHAIQEDAPVELLKECIIHAEHVEPMSSI